MRILTLTDHETHRKGESIYPLLEEISKNSKCTEIVVASRGVAENKGYYIDCNTTKIMGNTVNKEFTFSNRHSFFSSLHEYEASDFDVIFLRIDRQKKGTLKPFFHHLESHTQNCTVINKPSGIIETGSKEYLLKYPKLCPAMKLCRSLDDILDFSSDRPIVLKPLESYGGKGIVKIIRNQIWIEDDMYEMKDKLQDLRDHLQKIGPYLGMEYLQNNHQGDKRVVVVDDSVMGAILRYPREGSWLCNLSKGGRSAWADIDEDELKIVSTISKDIVKKGVVIYGFDTLVNNNGKRVLSEINTLNVGGLFEAELHSGEPVIKRSASLILDYCDSHKKSIQRIDLTNNQNGVN